MNLLSKLSEVRKYWFSDNSYKQLWFQSNILKRNKIDEYIYLNYFDLLIYVFNLETYEIYKLNTIDILSIIVCLDQFSRHIFRNDDINNYREKALNLSIYLCFSNKIYSLDNDSIIFALMPLKHLDLTKYFNLIKSVISKKIDIDIVSSCNLYRFYQDSLHKYLILRCKLMMCYSHTLSSKSEIESVCESYPTTSELEYKDYEKLDEFKNSNLVTIIDKFITKLDKKKIVISLSGGPDSMVLAYIFNILCKSKNINISAFHLNYNNREESFIEECMISEFCDKIGLDLYVHRINHCKRKYMAREFYEKVTRKIRFKMYSLFNANIILGHIKDDMIENIWTNFANGRDIFKLHKMDEITNIDDIPICRPFIKVEKKDIYTFAYKFNIPFLKNTTPINSNRGKMRTKFLPEVKDHFGKDVSDRIIYVSETLESYEKILDKMIFKPFIKKLINVKSGYYVDIKEYLDMNIHFWQKAFTYMFHRMNFNMPKHKALLRFIESLENSKSINITFCNEIYVNISKDKILYVLDKNKIDLIDNTKLISIKNIIL